MFGSQSKLRTSLAIIFFVSLVALLLQLFYLLWRLLCRRSRTPTTLHYSDNEHHQHQLPQSSTYFFCFKTNLSRVEPNSAPSHDLTVASPELTPLSSEMMIDDVLKLYSMRGPSRVLFTIKEEEEREGLESAERSLCTSAEKQKKIKRVSLRECFEVSQEPPPPSEVAVAIDDHMGGNTTTPFSTPCDSPLYFTPSATPTRDIADVV